MRVARHDVVAHILRALKTAPRRDLARVLDLAVLA